jgi:hypothetical protein
MQQIVHFQAQRQIAVLNDRNEYEYEAKILLS